MNQAAASGRRASMAAPAGDAFLTANGAYTSVPPRAAALAAAAARDTGLGSRDSADDSGVPLLRGRGPGWRYRQGVSAAAWALADNRNHRDGRPGDARG